ncbi:MAG: hypothetical protein DRO04_02280 [Candidatus Iainarchaeum archaeon]|uniref:Uncharacterized protein n=1 Tax=Candidatus Iainarchaeum sp. TaxID=3101447 RepID=A0A497JGN3_9ARCH|nr:MAG: hypothetical protein DRO04_02280 [Candidatus Diapherotrites archaeon]
MTVTVGEFTEKFTITYNGTPTEQVLTLHRGTKWDIMEVDVYFAAASEDAYFQVLRKSSATTANERDASNSASHNVLFGEKYLVNGGTLKIGDERRTIYRNMSDTPLRLYLSLGSNSGTVYVTVRYQFTS